MRRPPLLLCVLAVVIVLPLFVAGYSCGHDFDFHLQSWLEMKRQLAHGTLRPHWAFSAAWGAGEPRFVFYPPLSWVLGGLLACMVPIAKLPAVFTLVVVLLAAQTMYWFARKHVSASAAMVAAALYAVNPYLLFTAYERTAYAELLAAAWMPLLLAAVLMPEVSAVAVAVPVALLWLTNAPAAVVGCYVLAIVLTVRLVLAWRAGGAPWTMLRDGGAGVVLGSTLAAFYLLPAALERKRVQIDMAVIPNMRVSDNFLFGHTGDGPHDVVLRQASILALLVLVSAAVLLLLAARKQRGSLPLPAVALVVCGCLLFLLTPASAPLWRLLPELSFLQFPWRFLCAGAVLLALGMALAAERWKLSPRTSVALACVLAVGGAVVGPTLFRQGCEAGELPGAVAAAVQAHAGLAPTDEYTPNGADNDALRRANPRCWFSKNADAPAPGTTEPPADSDASGFADAVVPSQPDSLNAEPETFDCTADASGFLILNLRNYPNWHVRLGDSNSRNTLDAAPTPRADGLIALPVSNGGPYRIGVEWQRGRDEWAGIGLSAASAGFCGWLWRRSRKMNT